jgi:hypothetical protein
MNNHTTAPCTILDPFALFARPLAWVNGHYLYLHDLRMDTLITHAPTPQRARHSATINMAHKNDWDNPRLGIAQLHDRGFSGIINTTLRVAQCEERALHTLTRVG